MPCGDSYFYSTLHCIINDLKWIERFIEENGDDESVEFKFTSLKKNKGILKSGCCHLILLIRDTNKKTNKWFYRFPRKRIKILDCCPDNFCRITAIELKKYLDTILTAHNDPINGYDNKHYIFPGNYSKPLQKNKRIKLLVDECTVQYPGQTKEEIFYKIAEQTEDTFDNVKRLYYHNAKKS